MYQSLSTTGVDEGGDPNSIYVYQGCHLPRGHLCARDSLVQTRLKLRKASGSSLEPASSRSTGPWGRVESLPSQDWNCEVLQAPPLLLGPLLSDQLLVLVSKLLQELLLLELRHMLLLSSLRKPLDEFLTLHSS